MEPSGGDAAAWPVVVNRGATDHDGHSAVTLRLDGDVVELFPPAVAEALAAS